MDIWQLLLVGVVQGLTEFLPISSSAHLVLLPKLLGTADQGLTIDIAAHVGTFFAALFYFRRDWLEMFGRRSQDAAAQPGRRRLLAWIALATLPVLVVGFLVRDLVASLGRDPRVVGWAFLVFGLLLGLADRLGEKSRSLENATFGGALFAGLFQAVALIPGASRSGTTITAGLLLGLRREEATRMSFLLFVPVSAAVGGYEALRLFAIGVSVSEVGSMVGVAVVSAVVAWLSIHVFLGFVRRSSMMPFVLYRIVVGLLILVLPLRG